MRQQDPRQRIQRNRALAVQIGMILAGLGVGTYFLLQAINGKPEERDFDILATVGSYGVAAFYVWLQVRRWRRENRMKQMIAEKQKQKRKSIASR